MNNLGLLKSQLRELTGLEWKVEENEHGWEIRYICSTGSFRYHTEWLDRNEVNPDLIRQEAKSIDLAYRRKK